MDIEQLLKETLDLTEYQILVYISLLEKTGTAGQLYRRLNINRATLYRILDELVSLNLIIKKQIKSRMFFEALHPESLKELYVRRKIQFEEKGRSLERVVHELMRKATAQPTDASISLEKGIHAHYRKMKLMQDCKDKVIRLKVNSDNSIYSYQDYPEDGDYATFQKNFTKDLIAKEIHTKLLTTETLGPRQKIYNVTNREQLKEARIFPSEILPNLSLAIFDDYSIFTERSNNPETMLVITIRNAITAELLKSMFDFIFDRSIVVYESSPLETFETNAGLSLPKIGIGTSGIGGYWYGPHPFIDDTSDIDQLRHTISKGITYIDNCLLYGDGHTVEVVGKAIKNMPRNDLFLTGKLTGNLNSLQEIEEQCNKYLKLLGTDYIDQFQIHSRKRLGNLQHEDVLNKIDELIHVGKVKHWGVSNYKKEDIQEAQGFMRMPLFANEIPYGVFMREYEKDGTLEYMQRKNITTIAFFTVRKGGMLVDTHFGTDKDTIMQKIADKYRKTPTQVAINWVTSHQRTMALIKSTNGTHINENSGAVGWSLRPPEIAQIDQLVDI